MTKLPFYVPENEMSLAVGKMMTLLNVLSLEANDERKFTLEQLAAIEFLVKHPIVLNKILEQSKKKMFHIENYEKYSIEALFPNRTELYRFSRLKTVLKILLIQELVEVVVDKNYQPTYCLNDKGKEIAQEFDSQFFKRLTNLYQAATPLLKFSTSKIYSLIDSYF